MTFSSLRFIAAGAASFVLGGLPFALAASPAAAATTGSQAVSQNWAGYIAQGTTFSAVSGSWVVPSATCGSGTGYSAFWVGLGGAVGPVTGPRAGGHPIRLLDHRGHELLRLV